MLSYRPGSSFAHRLDPRSKLLVQFGLAVAAVAYPTLPGVVAATAVGLAALAAARLSPLAVLRSYRVVVAVLALAPLVAGVALGPPWFRVEPALRSALYVGRVLPVLFVSAAYLASTPVRETRAAVQRLVPGKPGQLLGERRSVWVRARLLAVRSLDRTLDRSDRLSLALRARCFAWNPTLPALAFARRDYPVALLGVALALSPLARVLPL